MNRRTIATAGLVALLGVGTTLGLIGCGGESEQEKTTRIEAARIASADSAAKAEKSKAEAKERARPRKYHLVNNEDGLVLYFRIAKEYDVTVDELRKWNPEYGLGVIGIGDKVYLEPQK